ncbi:hypothetical protein IFR05_015098, partial [Cadophora sp. M221]
MEDQNTSIEFIKREAVQQATPWNIPTQGPGRCCSNALIECPNAASLLCSICMFDKFWSTHKKRCTSFPKDPIHEIFSSDPKATNYYKADPANPKSLDRPNVYIDIQNEDGDEPLACLDDRLQTQYM